MLKFDENIAKLLKFNRNLLLKVFKESLISESKAYYASRNIKNNKFKDSNLIKSIRIRTDEDTVLFLANDYIQNLDKGRKKLAKKIPINELIKWIKKNKIASSPKDINSMAFAMQKSIYIKGIKGRNFINKSLKKVLSEINKLTDKEIDKYLENL